LGYPANLAAREIGFVDADDRDRIFGSVLGGVGDGRAEKDLVQPLLLSRVDDLGAFQPLRQEADAPIDLAEAALAIDHLLLSQCGNLRSVMAQVRQNLVGVLGEKRARRWPVPRVGAYLLGQSQSAADLLGTCRATNAYYKCVSLVEGTNLVRRELGFPEAHARAADPKLYFRRYRRELKAEFGVLNALDLMRDKLIEHKEHIAS
jgi:hypothetical protein